MHAFCCFYMKVYAFSHKTLKQLKRFKNCALLFAKKKKKKKSPQFNWIWVAFRMMNIICLTS